MERKASAVWKGGLKDGKGTISAPGGVLKDTQYSFTSRFENGPGTNPEELIAAAHTACFSMELSAQMGGADPTRGCVRTRVSVSGWCGVSEIWGGRGDGLSRVESAEGEDFDDGEAWIGCSRRTALSAL